MKKTFAMLSVPGTFVSAAATPPAGRLVANTEFVKALARHGSFDRFCFFIGENGDHDEIDRLAALCGLTASAGADRLLVRHLLDLPRSFADGDVSVVHHASHVERFLDLVWLRDRFASPNHPAIPVTGQIHSLSYPDLMKDYLRALFHPPGPHDAIFCSSLGGQIVLQRSFDDARAALQRIGATPPPAAFDTPLVPLGVDVDRMRSGDRAATRARLRIAADEIVILGLGRFSEYDKMDLFPLLQIFQGVAAQHPPGAPPVRLLLAGARQGTQTPKMVELWAQALGVSAAVTLHVDFPEAEKPDLLAASDVFVSPCDNLQETFGLSVIEAMAAGLPVVVSDFDGYKDTVSPDAGVRVPTRMNVDLDRLSDLGSILYARPLHLLLGQSVEVDLPTFTHALVTLCADGDRRALLGAGAAARARRLYDWKPVVHEYEAVWHALGAAPFVPRPGTPPHHPAGLRFGSVFAHYPTESIDDSRVVRRTKLSRVLCGKENGYFVYPELRHVFSGSEVLVALAAAESPTPLGQVIAAASGRWPPDEGWRAKALVTWLLKHGLLATVTL
jgi:glycosyltransferase involved in cell wall biosynthesis